jgi:UDP:flavonoid glycosyltransferase YjiC (YdhE family)
MSWTFADNYMSAQRVTDRGVRLFLDPTTADAAVVGASVARLLAEPSFAAAALKTRGAGHPAQPVSSDPAPHRGDGLTRTEPTIYTQ